MNQSFYTLKIANLVLKLPPPKQKIARLIIDANDLISNNPELPLDIKSKITRSSSLEDISEIILHEIEKIPNLDDFDEKIIKNLSELKENFRKGLGQLEKK